MKRKKIVLLGVFITVISLIALLLPLNVLFAVEEITNGDGGGEEELCETSQAVCPGDESWDLNSPDGQDILEVCVTGTWNQQTMTDCTTGDGPFGGFAGQAFTVTGMETPSITVSELSGNVEATSITIKYECPEPEPEVGNITVVKRDPGGTLLAGAGFTVYYAESGNPAAPEGFTADSGMITFAGLPFGSYIVRETTAPAGFGLAPDQAVVLASESVAVSVNFVDDPITTTTTTTTTTPPAIEVLGITEELPFTGQSMWLYIIGAAMLALAGGLTFVLRAVRSKA